MSSYLNINDMFLEYSKVAINTGINGNNLLNSLFNETIPNIVYYIKIGLVNRGTRFSILKYNAELDQFSGVTVETATVAKNVLATYKLELENSVIITNVNDIRGISSIYIPITVLEDLI